MCILGALLPSPDTRAIMSHPASRRIAARSTAASGLTQPTIPRPVSMGRRHRSPFLAEAWGARGWGEARGDGWDGWVEGLQARQWYGECGASAEVRIRGKAGPCDGMHSGAPCWWLGIHGHVDWEVELVRGVAVGTLVTVPVIARFVAVSLLAAYLHRSHKKRFGDIGVWVNPFACFSLALISFILGLAHRTPEKQMSTYSRGHLHRK